MAATAWLMLSLSSCKCGFDSYIVRFKCPQRKFLPPPTMGGGEKLLELKDNISHAVAAIKIIMLHRVYLNMVTARLLTSCSNTLRNIHTDARVNITRTRAKRKAGYFFVAQYIYHNISRFNTVCTGITKIKVTIPLGSFCVVVFIIVHYRSGSFLGATTFPDILRKIKSSI